MANSTLSPNMGLVVPTVGQDPGPDWATNLNSSLGILDVHDHSSGKGVQITPAGLNINSDLSIHSNNLTAIKTVNFIAQSGSLAGISPNLGCIYVAGKELYYNDEVGNIVPITNNGSVNAGAGSITGLPSGTASASYSSGSQTFIWQSATSTPANMDFGSAIFRNISSGSHGVTVNAPSALGADYSLTWPSLPAQTNVSTLDASGNMGSVTYDQVGVNMTSTGANAILGTQTVFAFTNWTAYTPTITGMTFASLAFIWRQIGKNIEVIGQATGITGSSGTTFSISLPGSFTTGAYIPQGSPSYPALVGSLIRNTTSSNTYYIIASPSQSVVNASFGDVSFSPVNPITGSVINTDIVVNFSVPVN